MTVARHRSVRQGTPAQRNGDSHGRSGVRPYPGGGPRGDDEAMTERRRTTVLATALCAITVAEALTAVVAAAWAGLPWARLIELLMVSNVTLGLCLAAAGWPIAVHRPGNAVGWLLLGGGVSYASTGAGIPLLAVVARAGAAGEPGWQRFAMLVNGGWSWALTLFLPLALLCFPDGRLPGRGWRWLVVVVAAAGPLAFAGGALSGFSEEVGVPGYVIAPGVGQRLIGIAFALVPAIYLAAVTSLILRYRRGDDRTRRQLLWVLLALLVVVVIFLLDPVLPDSLLSILPIALLFFILQKDFIAGLASGAVKG